MPQCAVVPVQWKNRRAYRLSNSRVQLTVLLGGGHIADFRLRGSPLNVLWESPWHTLDPQTFSPLEHATLYGDGPAAKFLSGYTGHALVLGYFGMPSPNEVEQGMPLHGEAASAEWTVLSAVADDRSATLAMEVSIPAYQLHFRRQISLAADAFIAQITERVSNLSRDAIEFQWVEHAAFGEPFFTNREATLFLSAARGMTWPLGYEGHDVLLPSAGFRWPYAQSTEGHFIDLSQPFVRSNTGFVAALLADSDRENAFVAVHNRRHRVVAGYSFDPGLFPWIALWEENRARDYPPWDGSTKVYGVEFGTSPMPLGLEHARRTRTLFDAPVLTRIPSGSSMKTQYHLFLYETPPQMTQIEDVRHSDDALLILGNNGQEIRLARKN